MHYAVQYIGKPYAAGGQGPDEYDCWGLARAILSHGGHELPPLSIGQGSNATAIREIVGDMGWHKVDGELQEFDAVLCNSAWGKHISVAISGNGGIHLIHADDIAGVEVLHDMREMAQRGYSRFEVWRHA